MARGGNRLGSGRPALSDEEKASRALERKVKRRAAATSVKGKKPTKKSKPKSRRAEAAPVAFAPDGVKKPGTPAQWPFGTSVQTSAAEEPPKPVEPELPADESGISADTPLDLLLAVVRAKNLRLALRMQAASIAAPFVHAKPAPGGKKVAQADAAKGVASKFAATAPPLKLVNR